MFLDGFNIQNYKKIYFKKNYYTLHYQIYTDSSIYMVAVMHINTCLEL